MKIKETVEQYYYDKETGEITSQLGRRTISWGEEPQYVKLYLDDIMYLKDLPPKLSRLVMALLKRVAFAGDDDGLCVTLVARTKRNICKEIGWERISSIDNAIQDLIKGQILTRVDRGVYRFNPYLFGKGDWQDISQLRLEVNYDDIHGKTFKTYFEYNDKDERNDEKKRNDSDVFVAGLD